MRGSASSTCNRFAVDGLLSLCCARLAVLWGRLLTAPKAASKAVLKLAREAEVAVAKVGSIIQDAQEGRGSKGFAPQFQPHFIALLTHALLPARLPRDVRGSQKKLTSPAS